MDIRPLFMNFDERDANRGSITRAVEHIIQYYMESEDYIEKTKRKENLAKKLFEYMSDKEKEEVLRLLQNGD